jgi:glycosyltransferase involved in cell wall biosynthesis
MSLVRRFSYELRVRALDALNHPAVVPGRSGALLLISKMLRPFVPAESLSLLCRSHQTLMHVGRATRFSGPLNEMIERALIRACARGGMVESVAAPSTEVPAVAPGLLRISGIVLKSPRENDRVVEKGVLLLKNTERLDTFRRCVAMPSLLEHYSLILEPSWSGYANPKLLSFCIFRNNPIVVMSPCRADLQFLERLNSNLRPTPTGASDWVDPRVFRPLDGQDKRFDAVMVARWTLLKRHHLLFRALNRVGDRSYRVALVASNIAGDSDRRTILSMIDEYRLADQITVFEDLEPSRVNEILNQSKVNLLLSRQEGSNRSLFEGFFAGIPGLAFANNIGIPITHFTPQTGRLIAEHDLPGALLYFREHWAQFDPRPWALANIAPEVTTARLNLLLRQLAQQRHEPWTQDIACKTNGPELLYYPDESEGHGFATIDDLVAQYDRRSRGKARPQNGQSA